jgi:NAD(P)-dependent dehydrogenase (short-subunit alcohol dehydrogenase family)
MVDTRTVVVTGASSGIGRATALRLADRGWHVFATVRREADGTALVADGGGAIAPLLLDVADAASVAAAARVVEARLAGAGLDGLVNNAGMGLTAPVEHTAPEAMRRILEVNLVGQLVVIQALLPAVRRAKGRIVNIGSVGDHLSPPFAGPLVASKAGFAALTGSLRLELAAQGIAVVLVEPGAVDTPAVDKTLGEVEATIAALPPDGARLYGAALRRVAAVFMAHEKAGSPPDVVAAAVERALTDRRPRIRYPAGKDALKLTLLARLLPERLLDRAIAAKFGLAPAAG